MRCPAWRPTAPRLPPLLLLLLLLLLLPLVLAVPLGVGVLHEGRPSPSSPPLLGLLRCARAGRVLLMGKWSAWTGERVGAGRAAACRDTEGLAVHSATHTARMHAHT